MQINSVNLDKGYSSSAPWKIRAYYRGEGIDAPTGSFVLSAEATDRIISWITEEVNNALPQAARELAQSAMTLLTHNIPEAEVIDEGVSF